MLQTKRIARADETHSGVTGKSVAAEPRRVWCTSRECLKCASSL